VSHRELRLATYNLENLGVRPDEDSPRTRARIPGHLEALRRAIRRLDADAVAFQELVDPELLDPLLDGLGYPHVALAEHGPSPLRCGVFSRFPLSEARSVAAGIDLEVVDRRAGLEVVIRGAFSRPALQVTWDVPGFPVTLIVVHWKSKIPSYTRELQGQAETDRWQSLGDAGEGRLVTEAKRLAQAVQIRRAVDHLLRRDPEARVVVLGDFNDGLDSEGLRIVAGDARACDSPSLAALELVACEEAIPADRRFTQVYRGRKEMLDHILISQALLPHFAGAEVHNERLRPALEGPGFDPFDAGSDHAPLLARFRVPLP